MDLAVGELVTVVLAVAGIVVVVVALAGGLLLAAVTVVAVAAAVIGKRMPAPASFGPGGAYVLRAVIFNVFDMVSSGLRIVLIVSMHFAEARSM